MVVNYGECREIGVPAKPARVELDIIAFGPFGQLATAVMWKTPWNKISACAGMANMDAKAAAKIMRFMEVSSRWCLAFNVFRRVNFPRKWRAGKACNSG
jgi:hypothetical protein